MGCCESKADKKTEITIIMRENLNISRTSVEEYNVKYLEPEKMMQRQVELS
jgi:hypothetical protein